MGGAEIFPWGGGFEGGDMSEETKTRELQNAYEAAHSELDRANAALAHCRRIANGLRSLVLDTNKEWMRNRRRGEDFETYINRRVSEIERGSETELCSRCGDPLDQDLGCRDPDCPRTNK